ncbi:MAG: HDOD domain-containing protein [Candidatus Sedimenticola sp. 6PFRAG7]
MESFFIGRQAIFDRSMQVYAYELLYRDNQGRSAESLDGDRASSLVILNSFAEIGLERMVGNARAFINLTRNFIVEDPPIPFDRSRIVLEILEDIPVDNQLIACCQALSDEGYTLALDDFAFEEKWDPLLPIVDIIKVEVPLVELANLENRIQVLREHKLKLLAEKVETVNEYRLLHDMGFDLFQGYFFEKPTVVEGKRLDENRQVALSLLSKLNDPRATTREIEQVITQDPGFSYKILRYLNSAAMGMPKKVDSIKQAVIYLGLRQIQAWASLIVLSGIDTISKELFNMTLTRAHMCANLLTKSNRQQMAETGYTAGLLSTLDILMGQELKQIVTSLPLSQDIRDALLNRAGPLGSAISCALAYEHQQWSEVNFPGLDASQISECYLDATDVAMKEFSALID